MKKFVSYASCMALMAMLAAACGGASPGDGDSSGESEQSEQTEEAMKACNGNCTQSEYCMYIFDQPFCCSGPSLSDCRIENGGS